MDIEGKQRRDAIDEEIKSLIKTEYQDRRGMGGMYVSIHDGDINLAINGKSIEVADALAQLMEQDVRVRKLIQTSVTLYTERKDKFRILDDGE